MYTLRSDILPKTYTKSCSSSFIPHPYGASSLLRVSYDSPFWNKNYDLTDSVCSMKLITNDYKSTNLSVETADCLGSPLYPYTYVENSNSLTKRYTTPTTQIEKKLGKSCGTFQNANIICDKGLICNRANKCVPHSARDDQPLNINRTSRLCVSPIDKMCVEERDLD